MIIIKYIVKKILKKQLFILFILFLVLFCQKLVQIFNFSIGENIPVCFVFYLVFFSSLEIFKLVLLFSFFLGILITLKKLYIEREIIAMYSCGLGKYFIYCSVFIVCVFNTIFVAVDLFWISPWSLRHRDKLLFNIKHDLNLFKIFNNGCCFLDNGVNVLFVNDINNNQLHNIFMVRLSPLTKEVLCLLVANSGYIDSSINGMFLLILNNGVFYEGFKINSNSYFSRYFSVMSFDEYQVLLYRNIPNIYCISVEQMNICNLLKLSTLEANVEFHWRLILMVSIWIMSVFSIILSINYFYQNYFFSVFFGIVFYLFFFCYKLSYVFIMLQ